MDNNWLVTPHDYSPHSGHDPPSMKFHQVDPKFAEACQSGLTWRIMSQVAVAEFPDLPSLIQSASNCTGQLAKGEHEVQLMRRICNTMPQERAICQLSRFEEPDS